MIERRATLPLLPPVVLSPEMLSPEGFLRRRSALALLPLRRSHLLMLTALTLRIFLLWPVRRLLHCFLKVLVQLLKQWLLLPWK